MAQPSQQSHGERNNLRVMIFHFHYGGNKRQLFVGDVEVNSGTERFTVVVEKRHQNHKCQLLLIGFLIKPIKYLICHDVAVIVAEVRLLCDFPMANRVNSTEK